MLNIGEFVINATVLITLVYISSLVYKQFFMKINQWWKNALLFFLAIFSGWVSMFFGVRVSHDIIFDLRFIPVIVAALFAKNPLFVFISGIGIGLARLTFGLSEAAITGFFSMVFLSLAGALLPVLIKEWSFLKRMLTTVFVLNSLNVFIIAFSGVIPFRDYLKLMMPVAFPINLCLSLLLLWIINDLYNEHTSKMTLMESAQRDPLTKLYNRRAFMRYHKQFVSGERAGQSFVMAFIDIDHFKKVNDTYGHIVGDLVLQTVSARIVHNLRSIDIVARYGGEEFVVILPNCTKENAAMTIERIRERVEQQPIHVKEASISITLSAGLAAAPECAPEHLLKAADDALYEAKQSGRNKVVCAAFEMVEGTCS